MLFKLDKIRILLLLLTVSIGIGLARSDHLSPARAAPQDTTISLSGQRILYSSLATADFNGDGYKEIVAGGQDGMIYVVSTSNGTNWSTVWSRQGNTDILAANPPTYKTTNEIHSSPAIADLDGDGHLDIVVAMGGDIHTTKDQRENGGVLVYRYSSPWSFSLIESLSPDGTRGWPQPRIDQCGDDAGYGSPDGLWDGIATTPALGDLDGDGDLEIVVAGIDRRIHAWHHTGEVVAGWPIYRYNGDNLLRGGLSSPALGDIDNDGLPEVVVGTMSPPWDGVSNPDYTKSTLWAINGDSTNVPGFPVTTEQCIHSSPALADIDGDGNLEIVVGAGWGTSGRQNIVYAWNHDGTLLPNWPRETAGVTSAPPALGDIDNDGELEIVITCGSSFDDSCHQLYAWNPNGTSVPGFPMEPPSPNPWIPGAYTMPYSPILADTDGDGQIEVVVVHHGAQGIAIVESDGTSSDQRHEAAVGGLAAPAVADDVDNDGKLEILVGGGNTNGIVKIWDENGAASSAPHWPMFRRSVDRTGLYQRYSISGQTRHANGQPFPGITITGSGGLGAVATDANGAYEFADLDEGDYTLTPSLVGSDYVFSPPTRAVTLPPSAHGQSFVILPSPVSTTVGVSATSLSYVDTQGMSTEVSVPAGAVSETTTLLLTPTLAYGDTGFAFAGHAFELAAYQRGTLQSNFAFSKPVTITINYTDADVLVVENEEELVLQKWTNNGA